MDERGTHNAVLHGLQEHPWVHLTCHGHLNLEDPLTSCFALHDARLSLASIVQEKLPNAELAFLSACHSAGGDPNTPDEILHLAAGMQFAGFRGVVGTMWAMADVDGPTVVEAFYRNMFGENGEKLNHTNAAKALNLATKELRKRGVPLDRWINFIHIGA
jgi:CHAT domain-containing protein